MPIDQLLSALDPQYQELIKESAKYLILGASPFLMYWAYEIIGNMGGGVYHSKENKPNLTKSKLPQYDGWIHATKNPELNRGSSNQYNIY